MPWLIFQEKAIGTSRFTYLHKEYKKSLKTRDREDAEAALHDVESRIHALLRGLKQVPANVDPGDYIVWGDAAAIPSPGKQTIPTFRALREIYLEAHKNRKAPSTIEGERIHLQNVEKCLGAAAKLPIDHLHHRHLDAVLRERLDSVTGATVNKERRTLLSFFKWVIQQGYMKTSPTAELTKMQEDQDRPPFRTLAEIEGIIQRGEVDDSEVETIWECLYLTQQEIGEILALVKTRAKYDFAVAMFAIIAYTGMRRGEVLRLRWLHVDFQRKIVTARSRKQSRQTRETLREIDLHPELEIILREYRKSRPEGRYVICRAGTMDPLTLHQANNAFHQPLRGTRWEREMPSGNKKVIIGFHTFRHSFASNLAVQGVDQRIIDHWMGHVTEEMRKRYQHLFPNKLADAIQNLSFNGIEKKDSHTPVLAPASAPEGAGSSGIVGP